MVNIEGLNHPAVLASLYNKSKGVGVGQYQYNPKHTMTYREAETILETKTIFDMLYGRVLYFTLDKDTIELDDTLYDKYLKDEGRMQRIIDDMKSRKGIK